MKHHIPSNLKELLIKYLERKCSKDEKLRLYNLLLMPENEISVKDILLQNLHEFNEIGNDNSVDFDLIYKHIISEIEEHEDQQEEKQKTERKTKIISLFRLIGKVAAIFIPAFVLGVMFMHLNNSNSNIKGASLNYCEIKAPLGAKSEITLPDGSHVLLNAGSKLKYFTDFNIKNRNILLEGEAYFKVAKNKKIPLIVSAANINIRAVGTEFNVKVYSNERLIETTLIEGVVEISKKGNKSGQDEKISLIPNQKAVYVKADDKLSIYRTNNKEKEKPATKAIFKEIDIQPVVYDQVDIAPIIAWTQDKLMFRGETLENICVKLNRKYDVSFEFENETVKNLRFTGTLEDETIEQVLNVIKTIAPIDYTINKKAVVIKENTRQASRYMKFMKNPKNYSLNN
jgi:ferric-dicitrate binding protein FerR (iron transport regulator)